MSDYLFSSEIMICGIETLSPVVAQLSSGVVPDALLRYQSSPRPGVQKGNYPDASVTPNAGVVIPPPGSAAASLHEQMID